MNNKEIHQGVKEYMSQTYRVSQYHDFSKKDTLEQEIKKGDDLFHLNEDLHYRWVKYGSDVELLTLTSHDALYSYGTVDLSIEEPYDIVVFSDKSTYEMKSKKKEPVEPAEPMGEQHRVVPTEPKKMASQMIPKKPTYASRIAPPITRVLQPVKPESRMQSARMEATKPFPQRTEYRKPVVALSAAECVKEPQAHAISAAKSSVTSADTARTAMDVKTRLASSNLSGKKPEAPRIAQPSKPSSFTDHRAHAGYSSKSSELPSYMRSTKASEARMNILQPTGSGSRANRLSGEKSSFGLPAPVNKGVSSYKTPSTVKGAVLPPQMKTYGATATINSIRMGRS